ncbi:hypothetical protein [Bordetella flabilis]|nr:hypothetical protein [Bordetella flabilis]
MIYWQRNQVHPGWLVMAIENDNDVVVWAFTFSTAKIRQPVQLVARERPTAHVIEGWATRQLHHSIDRGHPALIVCRRRLPAGGLAKWRRRAEKIGRHAVKNPAGKDMPGKRGSGRI